MAAARFVGCPSPSPDAASPRRPLPLRGRGGRRTSQLGSSILFSVCFPLTPPLGRRPARRQLTPSHAGRPKTTPSNPFGGWFDGPSEAKSILLSAGGLRRKTAAATSRPRAVELQVAVRFEIPRRLHAASLSIPTPLRSDQPPYAMKLRNMSRTKTGFISTNRPKAANAVATPGQRPRKKERQRPPVPCNGHVSSGHVSTPATLFRLVSWTGA